MKVRLCSGVLEQGGRVKKYSVLIILMRGLTLQGAMIYISREYLTGLSKSELMLLNIWNLYSQCEGGGALTGRCCYDVQKTVGDSGGAEGWVLQFWTDHARLIITFCFVGYAYKTRLGLL
jgi:hypothetical protein